VASCLFLLLTEKEIVPEMDPLTCSLNSFSEALAVSKIRQGEIVVMQSQNGSALQEFG